MSAASRFLVALLTLATTLVSVVTAVLHLVVAALDRLTAMLDRRSSAPAPISPRDTSSRPALHLVPSRPRGQATAPAKELTPSPAGPPPAERLTTGLVGMGFRRQAVERFVASVGTRVETAPLPELIREGLAVLTRAA